MNSPNDVFDANLRFYKVTVGTKGFTASTLVFTGKRGHHDHLNVFCLGGATKDIEHVKATDLWHHDVTDDKVRTLFNSHSECFFTVAGGNNSIPFGLKTDSINFAEAFVVFN